MKTVYPLQTKFAGGIKRYKKKFCGLTYKFKVAFSDNSLSMSNNKVNQYVISNDDTCIQVKDTQ